jgi:hypothetical protein
VDSVTSAPSPELADDLVEHQRAYGRRTLLVHSGGRAVHHLDVEVGRAEAYAVALGSIRTLARIGIVLRRSTTDCACATALERTAFSMLIFMCRTLLIPRPGRDADPASV